MRIWHALCWAMAGTLAPIIGVRGGPAHVVQRVGGTCYDHIAAGTNVALDNAGTAFSINRTSCGCERSLELLRPLADTLLRGQFAVIAGHAHRVRNAHSDALSHSLCDALWSQVVQEANVKKPHRAELHFAVLDVASGECFVATMSFQDPVLWRRIKHGARDTRRGSKPEVRL